MEYYHSFKKFGYVKKKTKKHVTEGKNEVGRLSVKG